MSESDDELELQALQRHLDDAFATTRPRRGFEDELWLQVQEQRPTPKRVRGFFAGFRAQPAAPLAAVAAALVVVLGVGLLAYGGLGRGGATGSSTGAQYGGAAQAPVAPQFGRLPAPATSDRTSYPKPQPGGLAASSGFTGPVTYTWSGQLNLTLAMAPVYRYHEPSAGSADQFAAALGAVLDGRPAGLLGSYQASDYTLQVRGTVQSPPQSPAYFILAASSMPSVQAANASPADIATLFLAEHSLVPVWQYRTVVSGGGGQTVVTFQRQFTVPGYGPAFLVDAGGSRYGLEVDLDRSQPTRVAGLLPVNLEQADYQIVGASQAIGQLLAEAPQPAAGPTPTPTVKLTQAELAYTLVPAGDHSFYEPVFLFSGSFQVNGVTYVKHVVIPAVDPSQRA